MARDRKKKPGSRGKTSRTIVSVGKVGKSQEIGYSGMFDSTAKRLGFQSLPKAPLSKKKIALQGSSGAKHFKAVVSNKSNKNKETHLSIPMPAEIRVREAVDFISKGRGVIAVITSDGKRLAVKAKKGRG